MRLAASCLIVVTSMLGSFGSWHGGRERGETITITYPWFVLHLFLQVLDVPASESLYLVLQDALSHAADLRVEQIKEVASGLDLQLQAQGGLKRILE